MRHWRGELPLAVSYWLNGFFSNILLVAVVGLGAALQDHISLRATAAFCLATYAFSLLVSFWQIVGTWRSAGHHVQRGGSPGWATAARVLLLVGIGRVVMVTATQLAPQSIEFGRILCGDKQIPAYTIQIKDGGKTIEFTGGLRAGSASVFEPILRDNPGVQMLRLDSPGGRVQEARRIGQLVHERGLKTYTSKHCCSAATLVFIAGKERIVAEGARIGFHGGSFAGVSASRLHLGEEPMRLEMVLAGIASDFIDRALATSPSDMWYPSVEEMKTAGVITREDAPLKIFSRNMSNLMENPSGAKLELTGHDEIDRFMKTLAEFTRRWSGLFKDLEKELQAAGQPEVFSERILQDQAKLEEAVKIQLRRTEIFREYSARAKREVGWLTNETAGMKFTEPEAAKLFSETDQSLERGRLQAIQNLNLRWNLEIDEERFLHFMLKAFSYYRVTGSSVEFNSQEGQRRYLALKKEIIDASKACERAGDKTTKSFEEAKEAARKFSQ